MSEHEPAADRTGLRRRLMSKREYKQLRGNPSEMTLWREENRENSNAPKPVRINGRRYWFEDEATSYLDSLAAQRLKPNR